MSITNSNSFGSFLQKISSPFDCLRFLKCFSFIVFLFISLQNISAQCNAPGDPACKCGTAPILCNIGELDGYSYSMSTYQHATDGPNDNGGQMCPDDEGTVSHNPTWFAFIAWCTNLTLQVNFSGCTDMQGGPGVCAGLQAAVYDECFEDWTGDAFESAVACSTDGQCNSTSGSRTLSMTGLAVGQTYYFLVDGCCGSACSSVTIEVVGECGLGDIEDWFQEIAGPDHVCLDQPMPIKYWLDFRHPGATGYVWTFDGTVYATGPVMFQEESMPGVTFTTPGFHEICVDVSNLPCIDYDDFPPALCKTICVAPQSANAGTIQLATSPSCPGTPINITITGNTTTAGFNQYVFVTDNSGTILEFVNGTTMSFVHGECEDFMVYSYNYYCDQNAPEVGMNVSELTCEGTDCTCDIVSATLSFNDTQAPTFSDAPDDITVDCFVDIPVFGPLDFIDNCSPSGTANGTEDGGNFELCIGGVVTRNWEVTDQCGNSTTHTQSITVDPVPEANFVSPPADITITCENIPNLVNETLSYTNGGNGSCLISGAIPPTTIVGTPSICGATIVKTWNVTDICDRLITHTQTVTITPSNPAVFLNPPANVTLNCDQGLTYTPQSLNYSNNSTGGCLIQGSAAPNFTNNVTICGGSYNVTYTFTDVCNRTINHNYTVTILPPPPAAFVNPPGNLNIDCDEISTITAGNLDFTNGLSGGCGIVGFSTPVLTGTPNSCGGSYSYTWQATDVCNRSIEHTQNITVAPPPAPMFVDPPADITVLCDAVPTGNGIPLQVINNAGQGCDVNAMVNPVPSGTANICGGTLTYTWTFTDQCQNTVTEQQNITVTPMPAPTFVNPPANITVNCDQVPTSSGVPLQVVNNGPSGCNIDAMVNPVVTGTATICGGAINYTWTYTDACNRTISHVQTITVNPMPQATWVNPPANITVNCDQVPTGSGTPLQAINNGPNGCNIDVMVNPTITGTATICGGTITYTWTYTDACNRTITHVQTVTVTPMPAPIFVNPPSNITVACINTPLTANDLTVTNNGPNGCNINTTVPAVLEGTPNVCGGSYNFRWTYDGQCQDITHVQTITTTPPPQGTFQNAPSNVTVNCEQTPQVSDFPSLTFTNNLTGNCGINATVAPVVTGIPQNYCGGVATATWTYTDICQRTTTYIQTITVTPAPQASILNVPPNITVDCAEIDNSPITLPVSNNAMGSCLISASVNNNRSGTITYCGGTLTDTWTFTDLCGRSVNASRTITVSPAPAAEFTTMPADITVQCLDASSLGSPLSYSNGLTGSCGINGEVSFIPVGNYNSCGGQLFGTWAFTDQCNRSISYIQNITVLPSEDPDFINPPMDENLGCGGDNTPPATIEVSNGISGVCGINIAAPLISVTEDEGLFTNVWQYTHPCTNEIFTHTQVTATIPQPNLFTEDPEIELCAGQTFDLSTIIITDLNDTDPVYTYHSTLPGDASNEVLPEVMPNDGDIYFIQGTNSYGCTDAVTIYFLYQDNPQAGGNGSRNVCNDGSTINLNTLLNGNYDTGGSWIQVNGNNINLSNPAVVNFLNIPAGNYSINYIVESTSSNCPSDTANFTINVTNRILINIATLDCKSDGTYEIKLTSNANTVTTTSGTVQKLTLDTFRIFNIPQGQSISISASSTNGVCSATTNLAAPNCACPFIAVPAGQEYYSQCGNINTPISMNVTVSNGLQANWYSQAVGGVPILTNSLSYNHTNFTPGTYSYFVETFDPVTLCVSLTRLEIVVEILTIPTINNYSYELCDIGNNGVELFDLNSIHSNVTSLNNVLSYHLSSSDALNGINNITSPYSNTSNPQTIFTRAVSTTGCINTNTLILILNATPIPTLVITDESCFGSDDGSVLVSNHNSSEGWEYSFDNVTFSNLNTITDLEVNNYVLFTQNDNGCKSNTPFSIGAGMIVNITTLNIQCDNNGTLSDPNDDVYTVTINAQNSLGVNGNYNVTANGNLVGTFAYGVNSTFNLPANGATVTIVVSDVTRNCSASRNIGPLTSCSTDCIASLNIISTECDDNNTPTIPNDDFYTITFNASSQNGSSTNDFLFFVESALKGKFTYGQQYSITTPATGTTVQVRIQDSEDLQCNANLEIGPLVACSDECLIEAEIESITCFNPGNTPDPLDDYYEIEIFATLINGGNSNDYDVSISNGTNESGVYGQSLIITLPANNASLTLTISDNNRPECNAELTLPPLTQCSEPCDMNIEITNIECNNAGTNNNDEDDTYTFDIIVTGNNNKYIIDELNYNGVVGNKVTLGPYLIIDGIPNLTIYYESNPNCKKFATMQIPGACSSCGQTVDAGTGGEISCVTPSITLTGTSSQNGNLRWELNNQVITYNTSITVGQAGTYYFIGDYGSGCFAIDSVVVTIDDDLPVVTVSRGHLLNCDIKEVTITGSATGSNLTFEWTNAAGEVISNELTITVNTPGSYYFQAINDITGCSSSKVLSEVILSTNVPSSVIYARPTTLIDCVIKSVILYTDEEENVVYSWRSTSTDFTSNEKEIEIFNPGNYILLAIDTISNCESESDFLITEFIEYPIIFLAVEDTLTCLNESVVINISGTQTGADIIYKWKDENKNIISTEPNNITVTEPGIYYLELSNIENGCINEDTIQVEIFANEIGIDLPITVNIQEGSTYQINAEVNIPPSDIKSISWSPSEKLSCSDCLTPSLLVVEDGEFLVTVEDIFGCKGMAVIRINSVKEEVVTIPNIISTSSGSNGGFTLYGNDQVTIINYLKIFDRWGNLMFHRKNFAPNDPTLGWNGKINGKHVEQGVYVYVFEIELLSGKKIYTGDLTVIR